MSHFAKVQLQITSREVLTESLKQLGYTINNTTKVKGYKGNKTVEFTVSTRQGGYPIGFRKAASGAYEVVADWWGVNGVSKSQFMASLNIAVAEREVRAYAKTNKFRVIEEKASVGKQLLLVRRVY